MFYSSAEIKEYHTTQTNWTQLCIWMCARVDVCVYDAYRTSQHFNRDIEINNSLSKNVSFNWNSCNYFAQSAAAVEYTDCSSAEG